MLGKFATESYDDLKFGQNATIRIICNFILLLKSVKIGRTIVKLKFNCETSDFRLHVKPD